MATSEQVSATPERQPYVKPRLEVVDLAAREVLAVGCKTAALGNNAGAFPCAGGTCAAVDAS